MSPEASPAGTQQRRFAVRAEGQSRRLLQPGIFTLSSVSQTTSSALKANMGGSMVASHA